MTLPTTEVTIFETNDVFRANPEGPLTAFDQARSKDASVSVWYGHRAENPSVGFVFANWDSYEQHKTIMDAPFCKQFLEVLAPALSGPFKLDHVIFSSPTIGLDYPVTENRDYYFDLEGAPENLACVVEILFEIAATIKNLFVFWPTRNDENRYRALCGTVPGFGPIAGQRQLTTLEIVSCETVSSGPDTMAAWVYKSPIAESLQGYRSVVTFLHRLDIMALTTEILIFETSDAFRKSPGLGIPAFNIVLKANGVHAPAYYGKQIENPSTGYIFLNWDDYEAHKAIMDAPSYSALLEALTPCLSGTRAPEMYHVQFSAPTIALEKPVTEVLILTLKAPENRATVVDILSKISESSGKILVFGQTREDENKYILIGGWQTVEAHWETVAKPEVTAALDKLYSLANKDHLYHTNLLQYQL